VLQWKAMLSTATTARFGRYDLVGRIARGGMAEILLARVHDTGDEVVIKRILPSFSERRTYISMFMDEARLASKLDHRNIVQVLDYGEVDGQHFLTMERIHGTDLRTALGEASKAASHLPLLAALRVAADAAAGLHHAHELRVDGKPHEVVHRDVSPSNLMITWEGTTKVVDFGIARAAERVQTPTATGTVKGKLRYTAPEIFRGARADRRCDVFSLGAVLHEMIRGQQLFAGDTDAQILRAVLDLEIPSVLGSREGVTPEIDAIVTRALQRDPWERYQTAGELAVDLEGVIDGRDARLGLWMSVVFGDRVNNPDPPDLRPIAPPAAGERTAILSGQSRWWPAGLAVAGIVAASGIAWSMRSPAEVVDDRLDKAMALAHREEFHRAAEWLDDYLEDHPRQGDALVMALLVQWWQTGTHVGGAVDRARAGDLDAAEHAIVDAVEAIVEARYEAAEQRLAEAVEREPERADLQFVLGEAEWHDGRLKQGAGTLLGALHRDSTWLMASHHIVDLGLATGDFSGVEALLPLLSEGDPARAVATEVRLLQAKRQYPEALARLHEPLLESPRSGPYRVLLAQTAVLAGDLPRAQTEADTAWELWSTDSSGRQAGGLTMAAEMALATGDLARFAEITAQDHYLRAWVATYWDAPIQSPVEGQAWRPEADRLLSPDHWVAQWLEASYEGGQIERLWETYPAAAIRHFGAGVHAEHRGDLLAAEAAYGRALEVPSGGEAGIVIAYHLARVRRESGDVSGASEACDEVLFPRVYMPYRAVLLPDCLAWTAEGPPAASTALTLIATHRQAWSGRDWVHPAIAALADTSAADEPGE